VDNTLPYGDPKSLDLNNQPTAGKEAYKNEGKGFYEDGWRFGSFPQGSIELGFAF
jgi:hypothetical protein